MNPWMEMGLPSDMADPDKLKARIRRVIEQIVIRRLGEATAMRHPDIFQKLCDEREVSGPPIELLSTGLPSAPVDRRCKLTAQLAAEMRHAYETEKPKPSMRRLAERFDVSVSTVSNIINGRYWKE
jgi:hypothetical protein